jgi:hypothetical protein
MVWSSAVRAGSEIAWPPTVIAFGLASIAATSADTALMSWTYIGS